MDLCRLGLGGRVRRRGMGREADEPEPSAVLCV